MKRLTKKYDGENKLYAYSYVRPDYESSLYWDEKCVDKLGQLEDIEEELGTELTTLFNKYIKWQTLDTYSTPENDRVLVLCKDKLGSRKILYALPYIAEKRKDGKWYDQNDNCLDDYLEIIAWKCIDVIYEFGKLEELENEKEN